MKRKILTVFMVIAMVIATIPASLVFANGTKAKYSVSASKTTAEAGNEIEFTVKLDLVNKMTAFEFTLDIPSGLTLVTGSQSAISAAELGFTQVNNNESALLVSGYGSSPYTASGTVTLATFKCTVDSGVSGDFTVGLKDTVINDAEYEEEEHDVSSVNITVVIPVTGISINETSTIVEGKTDQLTAILTPANTTDSVEWSSSNESVATVSNTGLVTAIKKGTTTITAKAGNVSDTCAVTVNCAHTNTTPVAAKASTCKEQGNNAYTKCDDCGEIIVGSAAKLPLADHNYGSWINEIAATHSSNGTKGHYHCSVCGKDFDSAKKELADLTISNSNHGNPGTAWESDATDHWHNCSVVGCGVMINNTKAAHTFEWKTDKVATEDATGLKHEECTVCGRKRNENTTINKLNHTHTGITHHVAVAATCKSKGNVEYWTCSSSKCAGKYYSDAACQNEIAKIDTDKNSNNHTGGTELKNAKTATCYAKGYTGDTYCLGCNNKIATGSEIQMTAHTPSEWKHDETDHWKECTVVACGVQIGGSKAAHTGGEATCTNKAVCSVCGAEYGTVNASNHKNTEIRDAKKPTCTVDGYTGDTWCKDCKNKISDGEVILADGNHVDADDKWESDATNHFHTCGCGETFDTAAHTASDWIIDKEAAVGVKGSKHKECTVCGKVIETAEIDALTETAPEKKNEEKTSPKTGENGNLVLWIALAFVSVSGIAATTVSKKKRSHR